MSVIDVNHGPRSRRYNVSVTEGVRSKDLVAAIKNDDDGPRPWVVSARPQAGGCIVTVTGKPSDTPAQPTEGRVMYWLKQIADGVERRAGVEPFELKSFDNDPTPTPTGDATESTPGPIKFWLEGWTGLQLVFQFSHPLDNERQYRLEAKYHVGEPDALFHWHDDECTLTVSDSAQDRRNLAILIVDLLKQLDCKFEPELGVQLDSLPSNKSESQVKTNDTSAKTSPTTPARGTFWRCTGLGGPFVHYLVAGNFSEFDFDRLQFAMGHDGPYLQCHASDGAPGVFIQIRIANDDAETRSRRDRLKSILTGLGFVYQGKRKVAPRAFVTAQRGIAALGTIADPDQSVTVEIRPDGSVTFEVR